MRIRAVFRCRLLALLGPLVLIATPAYPQDSSAAQRNKQIARDFYEKVWFHGDAEAASRYFAPTYRINDPGRGFGLTEHARTQIDIARQWCRDRGDCRSSQIVSQVAEGDTVATYWVLRLQPQGTFARPIATLFGRVPLERRIVNIMRFNADGRIIETSNLRDDFGMLADLGYINLAILSLFALGGAFGMALMWFTIRFTRRRA